MYHILKAFHTICAVSTRIHPLYGASGSVRVFAIQLAKQFGAHVTGVASTANLDLVKSLGADEVVDFTREDFSKAGPVYDVVVDTVGRAVSRAA